MAANGDHHFVPQTRLRNEEDLFIDAEFGFTRPGFRQGELAGSVDFYDRHVFLRFKSPDFWPSSFDGKEVDELPRALMAAVAASKGRMKRDMRLTLCQGSDASMESNGDVLIFPDMIRYRRLAHYDVESFVQQVLVEGSEWAHGGAERLQGSYIFVCCHAAKDRRCGVCGPALVERFKHEIEVNGLQSRVSVCSCSHLGGHKYAGNVIIFGSTVDRPVAGHWYGYVTPDDVPVLLQEHILKGTPVNWLWRGEMGLSKDEQIKCHQQRLQTKAEKMANEFIQGGKDNTKSFMCPSGERFEGCCQQNLNACCQNLGNVNTDASNKKSIPKKVSRI